jgi:hypothetical protein
MASIDSTLWRELSSHLDHALELADGPRGIWLEALRAENPELAATIERLLAESRALDSEGFLEDTAFTLLSQASLAGYRLGPYTIDRLIGRGGMGEVWLASRSDGRFEGHCAIKFLAGEELRTVFVANAASCANRLARYDPALDLLPAAAVRAERDGDLSMFRFTSAEVARTRLRIGQPRPDVELPLNHLEATRLGGESALDTRRGCS